DRGAELVDRPTSSERGMILAMLFNSGIYETELLSFNGADFSFAEVRLPLVGQMTFRFARLQFADFSNNVLKLNDFRAAALDHARFRSAIVDRCDFSALSHDEVEPPYKGDPSVPLLHTKLAGADFGGAIVLSSRFAAVNGLVMSFDGALVSETDFTGSDLSGATFRDAILVAPNFSGTAMRSVDLDGAIVFDADFLKNLSGAVADGSFNADRFELTPIPIDEVGAHPLAVHLYRTPAGEAETAYRIKRVKPFG
ncbi:MAG: pentapeptide repeat-containing protein, partial [Hyphomicrobiales bacterium]|nr:pentapeptide repeat-containing protein [Hyphomicrobiales bacterium]